jgi:hypothetical protein
LITFVPDFFKTLTEEEYVTTIQSSAEIGAICHTGDVAEEFGNEGPGH